MSGMYEIVSVLASAVVALYGERLGEDETVETVTASLLEQLSAEDKPKKEAKKAVAKSSDSEDLDKLGKKELLVVAKEHNITGVSSLKVDELRAKIRDVLENGRGVDCPTWQEKG